VFSATVALRGATKSSRGTVGTTATVAGVTVECGDWVVGDVDGVVIVPGPWIEEIVTAGQKRTAREDGYFAALRGGDTTVDLLDLDASLVEEGGAPD
jgi:4-hydroxy-4-methyl-2-oxoglutarate aldolase